MNFAHLSDRELVSDLQTLTGNERTLRARMIAHLVEVEERRIHLKRGYSSLFQFCLRKLEMSEGEAFRRITAARLVKRFPSLLGRIERGDIHISHLVLLRDHLTEENFERFMNDACRQPKRKVQELVALHSPKPDVPSRIRKLPRRRLRTVPAATATATAQPTMPTTMTPAALTPTVLAAPSPLSLTNVADGPYPIAAGSQTSADGSAASEQATMFASAHEATPASQSFTQRKVFASVEPLSAIRFKVQLTATKELRDKLERAIQLMRHANPTGDLAVVIERALDMLIPKLESDKFGKTSRPKKNPRVAKPDHVTQAARRDVFKGEEQCTFVGEGGHRCEERAFLEVDHVHPRALGGASDSSNLQPLCAPHNRLRAEQTFGRAYIEKRIRMRREKSDALSGPTAITPTNTDAVSAVPGEVMTKTTTTTATTTNEAMTPPVTTEVVADALVKLGFRERDSRHALTIVMTRDDAPTKTIRSIESILVEAIALLTRESPRRSATRAL